jgi:hypothetical protein
VGHGGQRAVQGGEGDGRGDRQRAGRDEVARRDAEQVAEQQPREVRRRVGPAGDEDPRAEQRGDRDRDREVRADAPVAGRRGDEQRRARHAAGRRRAAAAPPATRAIGQAREHRVRRRLRRVRLAVGEDPQAQRAAGGAEQDRLEQGRVDDAHAWPPQSWCGAATTRSPPSTMSSGA